MNILGRIVNFFSSSRISPAVFIFLVTLFSFGWLLGYDVYNGDQLTYFPEILQKLDPGLFSQDILFGPGDFTLFDDFVAGVVRYFRFDMFLFLFLVSFVMRFIYFYAIYRIFLYFTENKTFSLLVLLIFLSGFVIYGTGMRTIAPMLLPKYIAIALGLLGLSLLFEKRMIWAALLLGLGFIFHPSGPLPFFAVFYAYILLEGKALFSLRTLISTVIPPLFLLPVYFFMPPGESAGIFAVIDEAWRQVILRRDSYYFLSTWYYPNSAPLYIIASIFFFFLIKKEFAGMFEDERKRRFLLLCLFVPAGLAVFSFVFADFFGLAFITQLSLGRGLMLWKILFNGLFAYYALRHIFFYPRDSLYNFLLWGVVFSLLLNEKISPVFLPALMFAWTARTLNPVRSQTPQASADAPSAHRTSNGINLSWLSGATSFLRRSVAAFLVFVATAPLVSYFAFLHDNEDFFSSLKIIVSLAAAGTILCMSAAVRNLVSRRPLFPATVVLLLGIIALPFRLSIYPAAVGEASFTETCDWIKANTEKSALFITEPFSSRGGEMRLLCGRGLFATRRDGGQVVFNRDYALEWNRRYDIIKQLQSDYSRELVEEVSGKYGIDYLLSDSPLDLPDRVFDNERFNIYKLR